MKINGHKFHELYWGLKEKYEDTKGIIRNRKSKKDRQHSGQKNKNNRTNNNLKNLTRKTKDRAHKPQFKVSLYNTTYKPYVSVKIFKYCMVCSELTLPDKHFGIFKLFINSMILRTCQKPRTWSVLLFHVCFGFYIYQWKHLYVQSFCPTHHLHLYFVNIFLLCL